MNIVNLTPHPANIAGQTFPPSGLIPRCEEVWEGEEVLDGIPIRGNFKYGNIAGLPPKQESTFYIVSLPVALAATERTDLLILVGQLRDEQGRIIGATGLASLSSI